jgi:phenol 2-monooxygenase (NADPH)
MAAEAQTVDVLICGSGSAGLCAAVWLSRYNINYKILERRSGPLQIGQADGVQTRTVEIFDSFGIAEPLLKQAYHVLEIAFWSPADSDAQGGIKRKRYAADKETEISHQPHVILNQAKLNELMIGELDSNGGEGRIGYGVEVKGVVVDGEGEFPVRVEVVEGGREKVYRANYVLVSISLVRGFGMVRSG